MPKPGELLLETGEIVEMRTSDNRKLSMRCSKLHGDNAAVDALPNCRYTLRAHPAPTADLEAAAALLLLEAGVLVKPLDAERVVILNLSDKIVRLVGGESLLDVGRVVAPAPSRHQRAADEESAWKKQRATSLGAGVFYRASDNEGK